LQVDCKVKHILLFTWTLEWNNSRQDSSQSFTRLQCAFLIMDQLLSTFRVQSVSIAGEINFAEILNCAARFKTLISSFARMKLTLILYSNSRLAFSCANCNYNYVVNGLIPV
jgi:hypothetical protein